MASYGLGCTLTKRESTDGLVGVYVGMIGLSEVYKFDQKISANHHVMRGKIHMHDLLLL
jgi:hypothetical protein